MQEKLLAILPNINYTIRRKLLLLVRALKEMLQMKPYIMKFMHSDDGNPAEEMFLCIHAKDRRHAQERYVAITGGESRGNALVSVTGSDKIEAFWNRDTWSFVTIPQD
jgi:hypothetical protein